MTIRERLYAVALERGLRDTTVRSYEVLLEGISLLDLADPDIQTLQGAIWTSTTRTHAEPPSSPRDRLGWR